MNHFYLTLPSNSSKDYFPDNTVTNYVTKLHNTVSLAGEWEVGLAEIHFPRTWNNVGPDEDFRILIRDCAAIEPLDTSMRSRCHFRLEVKVKGGYYHTMETLVAEMNSSMKKEREKIPKGVRNVKEEGLPTFRYNNYSRKVEMDLPYGVSVHFSSGLRELLGMDSNPIESDADEGSAEHTGDFVCDNEKGLHSLYVYCDVLESVAVGDTVAPLLRICNAKGTHGEMIHVSYDKPRYVPLQKKHFDSIEIDIRDNTGEKVPFESGNLVCILHFRRVKEIYFN